MAGVPAAVRVLRQRVCQHDMALGTLGWNTPGRLDALSHVFRDGHGMAEVAWLGGAKPHGPLQQGCAGELLFGTLDLRVSQSLLLVVHVNREVGS
jgi:hypothetical protein